MEEILKDKEDEVILQAFHADPTLRSCIVEMSGMTKAELGTLDRGDGAEEAVVEVMHRTSKALLQKWAEKKEAEAHETVKEKDYRPHRKKIKMANLSGSYFYKTKLLAL